LPVLFFAAARELSHVCLSAEVACLRCAAYEAVREIRSGRDKLSVLLDAEVAYGFGVIPLVQRLAPALHRVKRCAEAEGTTGRKGGLLAVAAVNRLFLRAVLSASAAFRSRAGAFARLFSGGSGGLASHRRI